MKIKVDKKLGINGWTLLIVFLVFPCLNIEYFKLFTIFDAKITFYWQILSICITVLLMVINHHRPHKTIIVLIIYYLFIIFSTWLNGRNTITAYFDIIYSLGLMLLFDYGLSKKPIIFLESVLLILKLLVLGDLITIIIFPNGWYTSYIYDNNWLLGYKTARVNISLPAVMISAVLDYLKYNKIKLQTFFLIAVSILGAYMSGATSGTVILVLYLIFIINERKKGILLNKINRFLNPYILLVAVSILFIALVLFENVSLFKPIIVGVLDKSMTLTGRTDIWGISIGLFLSSPIYGCGYISSTDFSNLTGFLGGTQTHNFVLSVLVMTGAIGGVLLTYAYGYIIRMSLKKKDGEQYLGMVALVLMFLLGIVSKNDLAPFTQAMFVLQLYLTKNTSDNKSRDKKIIFWKNSYPRI